MKIEHANPTTELKNLLLALISPAVAVSQAQIDQLSAENWAALMDMIRVHRLGALMYWQLLHTRRQLTLPVALTTQLAKQFKNATLRNLSLQRELMLVHRLLEKAGISHVPLKGACLAFDAYPQLGLRSMRDLDVLVPKDQALQAYEVLLAGGFNRMSIAGGMPEHAMDISQHLPPISSPSGQVSIELHTRLFHPPKLGMPDADLSESVEFWKRLVPTRLAGDVMTLESPTDLLFHLIVHAVYGHELNNGPLLLSDMAYLLDKHAVDWPLFWQLAEERKMTRGCELALLLMERYWGARSITWPETKLPLNESELQLQLNASAMLMLRDFKTRGAEHVLTESSFMQQTKLMVRKAFPTRDVMAAKFPVAPDSPFMFAWYPVRWWRLLSNHLPGYWRSKQSAQLHGDVGDLVTLRRWLRSGN